MEKGEVIELENGQKYAIAEVINLDNNTYYYIINIENNSDVNFAICENDKIDFINDENLYSSLMIEVFKNNKPIME